MPAQEQGLEPWPRKIPHVEGQLSLGTTMLELASHDY